MIDQQGATVTDGQAAEALWLLVHTMERLGARIHRDLDVEAADAAPPADPVWAQTLSDFSAFADDCMTTLADDRVRAVLAACPPPPGLP
ncbi:hypothetical protein BJF79_38395 [Actinomadura sp. CNU-125]|uniref:hypothetical protein n=1 Tax=Actinomadura sp. CNU-125 TaxID=1904961 RepID=UPI000959B883|nr:hypothetical protein [Actinomadura sp. CNU-125]OLT30705.1 hypothetical protein BJF79_38395 [Actinomadura sp. CNU-125]